MFRKCIALSLFVSFVAMSTSGIMMFVIEKPSFTIQMHPVHKVFGIIMILSVIGHLSLNYRSLLAYLRVRSAAVFGGAMVVILILLYGAAINNEIPAAIADPMDALAAEAESHE